MMRKQRWVIYCSSACALLLALRVPAASTNAPVVAPDGLAVLRRLVNTQTVWGAELGSNIEDQFNCAEYLLRNERCREALAILLRLHDTVGSSALARVSIDGCSGAFLLHAGLSRIAEAESYRGMKEVGTVARRQGRLARGYPWMNVRRGGLLLANLTFLPPLRPDEFDETRAFALELYPAAVWQMDHVTRQMAWRLDYMGRTREALATYEQLFQRNPRAGAWLHLHAGVFAVWLEDYRRAFQLWQAAITTAPLAPYRSYGYFRLVQYLHEYLPYATMDALLMLAQVSRSVAARYPADVKEVYSLSQWLGLSGDTQLVFETSVRVLEERGDATVSNLWQEGLAQFGLPEYARKLGAYDREAALYCVRLRDQPRLVRAVTLARRIETRAPQMTAVTSNQFAQALAQRWRRTGRYRREAAGNRTMAAMVAELEQFCRRWPTAPATNQFDTPQTSRP